MEVWGQLCTMVRDTYLSQILHFEDWDIPGGDLESESFGKIQERALKALGNYIPDLNSEIFALFNEESRLN